MLETIHDVQILDIDGKHHLIADGDLTGERAAALETELEALVRGDVMVIGDKPVTVLVSKPCSPAVLVEVQGKIFDAIND